MKIGSKGFRMKEGAAVNLKKWSMTITHYASPAWRA